jgi:hypothetical protein
MLDQQCGENSDCRRLISVHPVEKNSLSVKQASLLDGPDGAYAFRAPP